MFPYIEELCSVLIYSADHSNFYLAGIFHGYHKIISWALSNGLQDGRAVLSSVSVSCHLKR